MLQFRRSIWMVLPLSLLLACSEANEGPNSSGGGPSTGGLATGGLVHGGSSGTSQGGASQGGTSQGGTSQGGTSQGGTSQGGTSQGGTSQGGTSQGGASQGGINTGGSLEDSRSMPRAPAVVGRGRLQTRRRLVAHPRRRCCRWRIVSPIRRQPARCRRASAVTALASVMRRRRRWGAMPVPDAVTAGRGGRSRPNC